MIIAAIALVLDQVTKWIILEHVMTPPRVIDVTGFFNLVLVYNRGVSFGLFGDGAVSALVLKAVAMVVVAGLIWWMRQAHDLLVRVALGLVVGGAIG
ncbi:MAG: signal peptidase II, partial [Pseudomonadota bacterium]